jgi:4-hydroxy-2-oxoheptanedioate aldolase
MDLPLNSFKQALCAGRAQIGIRTTLCSPIVTEVLADCGFDYIYIDTEHAPTEVGIVLAQMQSVQGTASQILVRPVDNDAVLLKRLLDIGVQNFLIPNVQGPDDARRAVAATRYPPRGVRGVSAASRSSRYGRVSDYFQRADDEICVIAMLETRAAVENLEAIAAVEGIDALWVGPGDLAADFGLLRTGGGSHPEIKQAVRDIIARAKQCGIPIGIPAPHPAEELGRELLAAGCALVTLSSDVDLLARNADRLARIR